MSEHALAPATAPDTEPVVLNVFADPGESIPLEVVSSLLRAVGTMYPGATMGPGRGFGGRSDGFSLRLPLAEIQAGPAVAPEAVPGADDTVPEQDRVGLIGWDGECLSVTTPAEAAQALAQWAVLLLSAYPEAENYVEQQVITPEERHLAIAACWSKSQTPHQLRLAAEQRADRLQAELDQLRAQIQGSSDLGSGA